MRFVVVLALSPVLAMAAANAAVSGEPPAAERAVNQPAAGEPPAAAAGQELREGGVLSSRIADFPMYIAPTFSAGYSTTNTVAGSRPHMMQVAMGLVVAYQFQKSWARGITLGVATDYRVINQYSAIGMTGANYRGTRWNIASPVVGFDYRGLLLLADFQFLGNYDLRNLASLGGGGVFEVAYSRPWGVRAALTYPLFWRKRIRVGVMGEFVQFSKMHVSMYEEDSDLASRQNIWQSGLTVSIVM